MTIQKPIPRNRVFSVVNVGQFAARAGFTMPETLPETAAELETLLTAARAEVNVYQAQHAAGRELSSDDIEAMRGLLSEGGHLDTLEAALAAAQAAEADHSAEVAGLLSRAAGNGGQAPAAEGDSDAPDAPEDNADDGDGGEGADAPEGTEAEQREPVLAGAPPATNGGNRPTFTRTGSDVIPGHEASERTPGWNMHPGAPGYQAGMGQVGFADIARSLDRIRPGSRSAMRPNRPNKTMDGMEFARQVVSTLDRDVQVVDDPHALVAAINEATKAGNLARPTFDKETGSLTAAGGWCSPSEQLYDFCDVPDATDLVSLPEITINRGGIRWPVEPDLSGIFEEFEWFFTEQQLEATDVDGNPTAIKTCVEVPCTDEFAEIRLNAVGWCVEAGILQVQGWPELVEWFMRNLTQEHLRALSRRTILDMVAGSGAEIVIPATSTMGAMASVLNSLALVATNIRLKRGLSRTATIEGVAPSWFHEVIRADIAMRAGGVEVFTVTDAQIDAALRARNISLQFVGDWQTRAADLPGNLATTTWPDTVNVLLYPAGTWFRSMSNVIELGVMYPKEQLQVNRFTRMFTEDAIAVGKRCGESVNVKLTLDVSGATGALQRRTNLAA
ncbi:major capsid hexamer protein [Mycobacterium phage Phelemich]|uniref:Major capsid protein n=2 Tax=Acadianvirus reprobate TaxID=1982903 RepID=S5Y7N4_9CAUD|nr:major head protein [Mycobacterium phage Phelemich]YP_008409934.1 major head protein [Mycobacterium phage Reprobate]AGT12749.1 major capsid hexamer protein [Mycobacterium phage Reprobate]AGT13927.1 major capsid hexamer protein [Mycobacterium phage Phelemich]